MLPKDEWLPQAQRLAVGMRTRITHLRERRPNLTIGNEKDRWWCYCQSCKQGGVVQKDHVLLGGQEPTRGPVSLALPTDKVMVAGGDYEAAVGRFLASKGMMFPYLPELWVSPAARRVLMQDEAGCWHGRDLSERSPVKWLNYGGRKFVGEPGRITALTEDLFSMHKLRYAVRHAGYDVAVCCTLGASVQPASVLALQNCERLVWAYDGDAAGDAGFEEGRKRMRTFVPVRAQSRLRPPEGKDPKDMTIHNLVCALTEVL